MITPPLGSAKRSRAKPLGVHPPWLPRRPRSHLHPLPSPRLPRSIESRAARSAHGDSVPILSVTWVSVTAGTYTPLLVPPGRRATLTLQQPILRVPCRSVEKPLTTHKPEPAAPFRVSANGQCCRIPDWPLCFPRHARFPAACAGLSKACRASSAAKCAAPNPTPCAGRGTSPPLKVSSAQVAVADRPRLERARPHCHHGPAPSQGPHCGARSQSRRMRKWLRKRRTSQR